MRVVGLNDTNCQLNSIEEDSGIGWAVTFIFLAIVVGVGFLTFLDRQPMLEYKLEKAFLEIRDDWSLLQNHSQELSRQSIVSDGSVVDLDEPVDLNSRSNYPIRAASGKRFNRFQ